MIAVMAKMTKVIQNGNDLKRLFHFFCISNIITIIIVYILEFLILINLIFIQIKLLACSI